MGTKSNVQYLELYWIPIWRPQAGLHDTDLKAATRKTENKRKNKQHEGYGDNCLVQMKALLEHHSLSIPSCPLQLIGGRSLEPKVSGQRLNSFWSPCLADTSITPSCHGCIHAFDITTERPGEQV